MNITPVIVKKLFHPITYNVLDTISHDCGAQAGHAYYQMPFDCDLDKLETELSVLTEIQREIFAIGEQETAILLIHKMPNGSWVGQMLNQFFKNYLPKDRP